MGTICTSGGVEVNSDVVVKDRKKSEKSIPKRKPTDPNPDEDVKEEEVKKLMNWVGIDSKEKAEKVIESPLNSKEQKQTEEIKRKSPLEKKMSESHIIEKEEEFVKLKTLEKDKTAEQYLAKRGFKVEGTS